MVWKLNKIFLALALCFAFASSLEANCNNRSLSITTIETISIKEILDQLSGECSFSVVIKAGDKDATETLSSTVSSLNIKDLTLHEIFNILLSQNDLIYSFRKNILSISSVDTRIFKVDYITSIREGRAVVKASADSAPVQVDGAGNTDTDTNNQENIIQTTEKFDFWEKMAGEIEAIMNNGKEVFKAPPPVVNSNAGLVSVTGTKAQLERVDEYISKLNKSLKKQVMIDVRIVSVELNNEYQRGVDWSKFDLSFNSYLGGKPSNLASQGGQQATPSQFTFGRWNEAHTDWDIITPSMNPIRGGFILEGAVNINLDGVINFLDTTGTTRVVSSPKIMTMNNQQALISVGDNINYQILNSVSGLETGIVTLDVEQYSTFIGILLNLLPEISDDGKIMLRINPSLNSFKYQEDNRRQTSPRTIAPDTMQKKLSSVVHINSGDTVVLGGLISQESGNGTTKVLGLSSIPVLGYLFKSEKKLLVNTELVFIITPRIVDIDEGNNIKDSLKSLGFSDGLF
ncbi:MAG: pilus (MSHA type) biogenesis protein MshL [Campylobacter sp.]|uniref:pilus (MSHA type) biogenesis protein MshL n=1 Tax=Campylobacter sp. TaxID=205 RepID=UPI002A7488C2|nr:pilus (MSHA type) biogenesis protein MshL [Campylobacter sp.]MCI6177943.1 pilus (MSHA type) biogenesis protein MshL [Campylobacter sp.]MCI7501690.1 pilus (MSHA type) biogenesis protein MshL [Campylobacter sp.]MDY3245356.1 pilus (MSHA type) biogenesis protein MshL [Campylobacter sp.]